MKFVRKNLYKISLLIYLVFIPVFMLYADTKFCDEGKICNPIGNYQTINEFIRVLLINLLKIGMPIIALAIIYSGFLFVAARGKPEELSKAKDALTYTLIGAAILLGSWAIATLISNTVLTL